MSRLQALRDRLADATATVGVIYRKELVDTLRDRRTLATMILVPTVLYPLSVLGTSEFLSVEQAVARERVVHVASLRPLPAAIRTRLEAVPQLALAAAPILTATLAPERESELLRTTLDVGLHDAVLVVSASAARSLEGLGTVRIELAYDPTRPYAEQTAERVESALTDVALELRDLRMRGLGLEPSTARPIALARRSVATAGELGGHLAASLLPMLALFFIALSSFYPAVDLTAGEKERGTLATLLTAPVGPKEVVWGKYLCVLTIGSIAGLVNVAVMALTLLRALASAPEASRAALPNLTAGTVLGLVASAVVLAALVAAVMLVGATFARSFRDASNLLTPVMFACLAPGMLAALPTVELSPAWAGVPIAGPVLLSKALLSGRVDLGSGLVAVVSTVAYAALLLAAAARLFTDERALFSTDGRRADLDALLTAPPEPGPGAALAFVSVLFVGNYYGGLLLEALPVLVAMPLMQLGLQALPAIGLALWLRARVPVRETLGLALPARPLGAFGGAALVGLGAWLGVSLPILWLQSELPGQAAAARALEASLGLDGAPLLGLWLALAVAPAVAEELAFRGVVLGLLRRRLAPLAAVGLSAVLFGLLHGSVFRLLPTTALGLVLGLLALRTGSIWPGVVAHALTNGIAVSLQTRAPPELLERLSRPSAWALLGLVVLAAGAAVVSAVTPGDKSAGRPHDASES